MHIKAMPEDAKGQDWIALVKAAAAAAAKNKTGSKPRTSANSNKDKEKDERKWFKVPSKKEETPASVATPEVEKEEDLPTPSDAFGLDVESVPKMVFPQPESTLSNKRKNNQGNSFQAKRARLNKITGLLASKAVGVDGAEKKEDYSETAPMLEQAISPKPQSQKKNEADIISSASTQKPALLSSTLSSGKARSKKCKHESGDPSGCLKPPNSPLPPELTQVEDLTLVSQLSSSVINKTSEHRFLRNSSLSYKIPGQQCDCRYILYSMRLLFKHSSLSGYDREGLQLFQGHIDLSGGCIVQRLLLVEKPYPLIPQIPLQLDPLITQAR